MTDSEKALEALGKAFEEFKAGVDKRLDEVKAHGAPLGETEEKLAKINAEIDRQQDILAELETKSNRPGGLDADPHASAKVEHREAFARFMRTGDGERDLNGLAVKAAVNIGTADEGGNAVPEQIDREILRQIGEMSPMRGVATVASVGTSDYKRLVSAGGTASGWVGETASRPETNTSNLEEVAPTFGDLYANPAATQRALDDIFFDVEAWIASEVAIEFAEAENTAFTSGNGTNKPTGFLDGTPVTTTDASRAFGVLQYVASGASGAFAGSDPHEALIDLVYSLKAGYRMNSRFMTNRLTLAEVRKMKDGDGNLIWQPGLSAGQPQTLMGYPVTENEDMPAIAADSFSMAFGDFRRGYLIADRVGTMMLRDPYTNKPYVHFYTTKRVGGKLWDSNAIKVLKFAAS